MTLKRKGVADTESFADTSVAAPLQPHFHVQQLLQARSAPSKSRWPRMRCSRKASTVSGRYDLWLCSFQMRVPLRTARHSSTTQGHSLKHIGTVLQAKHWDIPEVVLEKDVQRLVGVRHITVADLRGGSQSAAPG
jgi:hypothetical protein